MTDDSVVMVQWVIYEHPRDYPEGYVLRRWTIHKGGRPPQMHEAYKSLSVEALRLFVQRDPNLNKLPRFPDDDPAILEVWL